MIKLGIERIEAYKQFFNQKRVGLITNHTGVDQAFNSSIDILKKHTNLVALFAPEHGVRGDLQAGEKLESNVDEKTGITVYSLYGNHKKPTEDMLKDIDVICYDIQDVGARFYTYIYTMAYAMMAAKAFKKKFIVFDRPNPLGDKVEGNLLNISYRSFVGYYAIPQRYGLTVGELAYMFNDLFEIGADLEVIPMENYHRKRAFETYRLPWVMPSPNIPTFDTAYMYMATCVFEGTNLSEGRGTTKPFSLVGAPWLNSQAVLNDLKEANLPGLIFKKTYFTPKFSKYENQLCEGIELFVTNKRQFMPVKIGYILLESIRKHHRAFKFNAPYKEGMHPMIDLLTGSNDLRNSRPLKAVFKDMERDRKVFIKQKKRYHLYE